MTKKQKIASLCFHCKNLITSEFIFFYVRHCSVNHAKMTSSKGLNQHGTSCYTTLEAYWFCKCFLPPYHSETTTFVNPELFESLLVFHFEAERWHCNTLHSTFAILSMYFAFLFFMDNFELYIQKIVGTKVKIFLEKL